MARKRQDFGSVAQRTRKDGTTIYRARFACQPCQRAEEEHWERDRLIAEASGTPEPAKPRVQHFGTWSTSYDEQQAWLRTMREEQHALDRDWMRTGGPRRCAWQEARQRAGMDRAQAVAALGLPLDHYAQRYLSRTAGAESTRVADRRLWDETRTSKAGETLGMKARFGHLPVKAITRADIRAWLRLMEQEPGRKPGTTLSASQIRQRFFLLRGVFKIAVEEEAVDTDPTRDLSPPPLPPGRAVATEFWLPTEDDMQRLTHYMRAPQALAAAVAFGAGLRLGELTALEVADLARHGVHQWTVRVEKSESQGKGRSRSATKRGQAGHGTRALPEWVGEMLEAWLLEKDLRPEDRLFPPLRGDAPSMSHTALRKDLAAACREIGVPEIGPQDLRAAGEAHVARLHGRAAAAVWARHGVDVQVRHYVQEEAEKRSMDAAGWTS